MKLFVWDNVLCDYTCGIAFAYAENVEQAREIIINETDTYSGTYEEFKKWQQDQHEYNGGG